MPQTQPQYSAFSAAANELRRMVAENHAARLAEQQERERLSRQSLEDSWKERQLAVQERPEMYERLNPDGSKTLVPETAGVTSAAPRPDLVQVRQGGSTVYRPKVEGLTSEDEPTFGFVRQADGSEVYSRLGEGVVQSAPPKAPREPNYSKEIELIGPDGEPILLFMDPGSGRMMRPELPGGARLKSDVAGAPKLSAGQQQALTDVGTALGLIDELKAFDTDAGRAKLESWLGPVAGRWESAKQGLPGFEADADFARFSAIENTLKNAVIKATTGAAMGVEEAQRIMAQLPLSTDKPDVWREKMEVSIRNLMRIEDLVRANAGAGPGAPRQAAPTGGGRLPVTRANPFGGGAPAAGRGNPWGGR